MTSSNGNISALLALCAGNSPSPVNSPHKGQWRGALAFSFIYAGINGWINNREAGDLRSHSAHYDVIVMWNPPIPIRMLSQKSLFVWLWHSYPRHGRHVEDNMIESQLDFSSYLLYIRNGPCRWWPKCMMTQSNGNIFRVTGPVWGESAGHQWIPWQRPVTQNFDDIFDEHLDKWLSKESICRWFETPWHSLWRHCNQVRRESHLRLSVHFLVHDCLTKTLCSFLRNCRCCNYMKITL